MTPLRPRRALLLAALFLAGSHAACGFANDASVAAFDGTPSTGSTAASGSGTGGLDGGVDASFGQGGAAPPSTYGSLCGGGCVPGTGSSEICTWTEEPGAATVGAGGATASAGAGSGGGGSGGGSGGGGSGAGASAGDGGSGAGGSGGAGGSDEGSGGSPPLEGQCRLAVDVASLEVGGACGESGSSQTNEPCLTASDCTPGLGCVAPAVCRPYCCGDPEACPKDSFCAPTPLAKGDVPDVLAAAPAIPVCVPATSCTLLDDSTCSDGKTCSIVRVDGTTSCIAPGDAQLGEACEWLVHPCGVGLLCSAGANDTCVQLCKIDAPVCPRSHTCQGGSTSYPTGFGVCVAS